MSEGELDAVTQQLAKASVGQEGVNFEGKSLKLNTEEDAKDIVDAINACERLEYLNLEGNTLGVDASKAIAKALESRGEFRRALWRDLFTGRMKTEIPKALEFLGGGLILAGARLSELDLSDNAFGPIGVEGLAVLLQSPTCYALQILKLNNNGLGISGGKMLSKALLKCHANSAREGNPLALKVFIAGRNRLENDGAKALAEVFKTLGSLQEIVMPQNGIYHVGVAALCDAFSQNVNLKVLNLNDNTLTVKGAASVAEVLEKLQRLQELNLGDCLLKTKGALLLAKALTSGHIELQEVRLESNEIGAKGGVALAKAMRNKRKLKQLILDGNQFGESGIKNLQSELKISGQIDTLGSLSEDEGDDDDDDEDDDENEGSDEESDSDESEDSDEGEDEDEEEGSESPELEKNVKCSEDPIINDQLTINVSEFVKAPTAENLSKLGDNRVDVLLREVKGYQDDSYLDNFLALLMKVSSLASNNAEMTRQAAMLCSDALYKELFNWTKQRNCYSIVNNSLLAHLGLIKSEDRLRISWNLEGCLVALEKAVQQDYFPSGTRNVLQLFLGSPNRIFCLLDPLSPARHKLMTTLFKY